MTYCARSLDFTYFTRVNPAIRFGGILDYPKYEFMSPISSRYLVPTHYFETKPDTSDFYKGKVDFPFIFKPNRGARGNGVHLVRNHEQLESIYAGANGDFILQDYCDYPIELGILYHRFPSGKSNITSIVMKEFLSVTGDGESTLEELVTAHVRAYNNAERFAQKFSSIWKTTITKGEQIVLEEIGNHCRGTKFIDACELITPELVGVFDEIVKDIPQFHYGRFDLKIRSIEEMYQGEGIQILELNGINSEAAHIYDPRHSLWYAYKTVLREMNTVFKISRELKHEGVKKPNNHSEIIRAAYKTFNKTYY